MLCNSLTINNLCFGGKNRVFSGFSFCLSFTYLLHMEYHIFGNMKNFMYIVN